MAEAVFHFGSTPSVPYYTLTTHSDSSLAISRTHPRRPTKPIEILLLSLEAPSHRRGGLVTYIFPRLAAMLAIDQSNALAAKHQLAPSERDEMQSDAVERAAKQEACYLRWNQAGMRYELSHPALMREVNQAPASPRTAEAAAAAAAAATGEGAIPTQNPQSQPPKSRRRRGKWQKALHITVSSHSLGSPLSHPDAAPVITVTNPYAGRTSSAEEELNSPASLRMSTQPMSDAAEAEEPLASLDFGTMTLHISATRILNLGPSLYAVDAVIGALLAIAVADEAVNPVMAAMDIWSPLNSSSRTLVRRADSVYAGSVAGSIGGRSYTGSTLYATLAEREDAEEEARLMRQLHKKDVSKSKSKNATATTAGKSHGWFGRKTKDKKKDRKTKVVVSEFDLEKYGTYQAGSREGQRLPGPVRASLEILFASLKFIVWLLSTVVAAVAWVTVNVTRCVTSEKF